jgi:hypothetical protein
MLQHAPARLFPAAAVVVIGAWLSAHFGHTVLPAEVASAATALIGYAAVFLGASSSNQTVDPNAPAAKSSDPFAQSTEVVDPPAPSPQVVAVQAPAIPGAGNAASAAPGAQSS